MAAGDVGIIKRLDPSKLLAVSVEEAIAIHLARTGVPAEIVDLNPADFKRQCVAIPGVEVREDVGTLLGEVFVGRRSSSVSRNPTREERSGAPKIGETAKTAKEGLL